MPEELKLKYQEAFEIDPLWAIDLTAARAKWIDQSQSHNVFMKGVSGSKLSEVYIHAWKKGVKTTYYLRSLAASQIEKSTLDAKQFGYTQKREYQESGVQQGTANGATADVNNGAASIPTAPSPKPATEVSPEDACKMTDPDCEACQ